MKKQKILQTLRDIEDVRRTLNISQTGVSKEANRKNWGKYYERQKSLDMRSKNMAGLLKKNKIKMSIFWRKNTEH